ncbi:Sporulation initiation phosphotransferase F [Aquisphaera giovannonii]|uniref:Sporulation initiation phosphotransferase F n=1 Tax=Aquisphaera giovannonii TaxID=406548 RepID=A0A5B9WE87_9BACT|nr:response regulator [Aquisphaera giovannonii]QEH38857.1 Sporulation initiation phosphotransferase F [Aquisphaera giovannonii]
MSRPASILIVEDEPNIRLVFRTALQSAGHATAEARDGNEALSLLPHARPALILLDLKMPGMGGMEFLRRLRHAGDETPVVIVTAHGTVPDAVEAMKLGAIDFLSKPTSPETLRVVVAQVLARHDEPDAADEPMPPRRGRSASVVVPVAATVVDLKAAKRALNMRQFALAAELLDEALDVAPLSPEANTLMGVLHECRGQDHAAYQDYRRALEADPHFAPARDNLRRYCERFGLDYGSKAINPAAD